MSCLVKSNYIISFHRLYYWALLKAVFSTRYRLDKLQRMKLSACLLKTVQTETVGPADVFYLPWVESLVRGKRGIQPMYLFNL